MKFVCYTQWSQVPVSANALFAQGAEQSMFLTRPWFENLSSKGLKAHQSMLLACVIEGDTMLAIVPLLDNHDGNAESLTHLYSSYYTLLLAKEQQFITLSYLTRGLKQLGFNTIHFRCLNENDKNMNKLASAMQEEGIRTYRGFRFYNWTHVIDGQSFDDYMADRSPKVRNTIARKARKLQREQDYQIRIYQGQDTEKAITEYHGVYKSSWKANELYREFLEGLIRHFDQSGWLRMGVLYIQNQPAAAQLWFVVNGKASIFRLAYDEQWKHYSPGSILTRFMMQYTIDTDKVTELDFLTGNEAYKQDWMSMRKSRGDMLCSFPAENKSLRQRMLDRFKTILKI